MNAINLNHPQTQFKENKTKIGKIFLYSDLTPPFLNVIEGFLIKRKMNKMLISILDGATMLYNNIENNIEDADDDFLKSTLEFSSYAVKTFISIKDIVEDNNYYGQKIQSKVALILQKYQLIEEMCEFNLDEELILQINEALSEV